jgi:hypothetical protein
VAQTLLPWAMGADLLLNDALSRPLRPVKFVKSRTDGTSVGRGEGKGLFKPWMFMN